MYPEGHARNNNGNLPVLLTNKFRRLASLGVADVAGIERRLTNLAAQTAAEIREIYAFPINSLGD
jgi:hypothetical protein